MRNLFFKKFRKKRNFRFKIWKFYTWNVDCVVKSLLLSIFIASKFKKIRNTRISEIIFKDFEKYL